MSGLKVKIEGTGVYLPKVVSSGEIETKNGIPLGWSLKYSGVQNRHHVTDETNGYMGARAAEDAMKAAGISLENIDMLISAGGTYDYPLPNQASIIKHALTRGDDFDFPAIDIDSTCLSFVTAMEIASRILDGKIYKRILIVSSEIASKGLDPTNWETVTLFGDGAAAAVLAYDPTGNSTVLKSQQKTFSEGAYYSIIRGGGSVHFYEDLPHDKALYSFKMDGKKLLKLAKYKISPFVNTFFSDIDSSMEDIDLVIPHQASRAGLAMMKRAKLFPKAQIIDNLYKNGNCIAASIPMALHDAIQQKKLKRGQTCFLIGTSAGFSIGAILFTY
ncbi:hypothetical protein K8354_05140 [Polaribacter litorisediminis]|uniref:3-oxoacyl-[acyl-carrier-protein] synthase III C-terminal domain-containing protein n=1 Tax=Polaribacter litorisediminis TaxID=1908341 RepID=UPI001CC1BF06|nr:3-oxoacyl-[acyl-carrier-protein] synthase III C-terminal domain-containing protein [Polaribacter litorisediminis]UAM99209.1 hypothetical protein K8354_05140 [Polaribacter litorisediminis]